MSELPRGSVLVVDDEVELMAALCEALQENGYEAVGTPSPVEALEHLRGRAFDLLVTDLMMPEMDGIQLLRAALDIDRQLVALLMTGQATVETAVDAMRGGAFDYVLKPFKVQALLPLLARAMDVRRLRSENLELRETAALYAIGLAVAEELELDPILEKVADGALEVGGADEVSILLPVGAGDDAQFRVTAVRGAGRGHLREAVVPAAGTIAGWVAARREVLALAGAVADPRFVPVYPRSDIRYALMVPMQVGGTVVGVLNVNATQRLRAFTAGQRRALEMLAATAAGAVERAHLYATVRRSEARHRLVVAALAEGVLIVHRDGRLDLPNERASEILGLPADAILLRTATDPAWHFVREDGTPLPPAEHPAIRSLTAGQRLQNLVIGMRKTGEEAVTWLSVNVNPLSWTPSGEALSVVVSFTDVTERKRAEEALRKVEEQLRFAQKMEAIGTLAGGIAHDFNNLLGAARGLVDLLLLEEQASGPLHEGLVQVRDTIDRGKALTSQVLAFSRRQALESRPVDVNELAAGVVKMLERIIGANIRLVMFPADRPTTALADPGQIEQVLMNLCVNARDAMPAGGTVQLHTEVLDLDDRFTATRAWALPGRYVRIQVSDTGLGMDAATRRRIFEPFFTTKDQGKGTGLGLAVVFGIVKQHGGLIDVESTPGQGTTFSVYLPYYEAGAPAMPKPEVRLGGGLVGGTETVLLADDEESLRRTAAKLLERLGYRVIAVTNGLEALAALEAHGTAVQLVISDVSMPKMGGHELRAKVRDRFPGLRFLFATGYSADSVEFVIGEPVPTDVITKPYGLAELAQAVRRVLDAPVQAPRA